MSATAASTMQPATRTYVHSTFCYVKSVWTSVQEKYPRTQFVTKRVEGVLAFGVRNVGYKTLEALDDWVIAKTQTVDSVVDRILTAVVPKSLANRQLSFSITGIIDFFSGCVFYFVPSFLKRKRQIVAVKEQPKIVKEKTMIPEAQQEEPPAVVEKKEEFPSPEQWLPEADKAMKEVFKSLQSQVDGAVTGFANAISPTKKAPPSTSSPESPAARSSAKAQLFTI